MFNLKISDPSGILRPGGLERLAAKAVREGVEKRLRMIVCDVHHESPRLLSDTLSGSNLDLRISACCDAALARAKRAAAAG